MPDMLVKLYDLDFGNQEKIVADHGAVLRRPIAAEKSVVVEWVREHFSDHWASECDCSFATSPAKCFVVQKDKKIVGFACYDTTYKGFFGPTGVAEEERGNGYGGALLMASLKGLYEMGYAYGFIGSAGPVDFYKKVCKAIPIEDSVPGIYKDMM